MAFNRIQFQHGMSIPEFMSGFGTEEQCAEAVRNARWPQGFRCPRCDRPITMSWATGPENCSSVSVAGTRLR